MAKDIWARTNVRAKLEAMQIACPAGRTSRGSISLGMIQVRGPHDHPNAALMLHMRTSMATAPVLESAAVPESPTSDAIMYAMATFNNIDKVNEKIKIWFIVFQH